MAKWYMANNSVAEFAVRERAKEYIWLQRLQRVRLPNGLVDAEDLDFNVFMLESLSRLDDQYML